MGSYPVIVTAFRVIKITVITSNLLDSVHFCSGNTGSLPDSSYIQSYYHYAAFLSFTVLNNNTEATLVVGIKKASLTWQNKYISCRG